MKKKSKYLEQYGERVNKMTNYELLDEYTRLAGGDDYDGCYTTEGGWEWDFIQKELTKRLTEIGFLK